MLLPKMRMKKTVNDKVKFYVHATVVKTLAPPDGSDLSEFHTPDICFPNKTKGEGKGEGEGEGRKELGERMARPTYVIEEEQARIRGSERSGGEGEGKEEEKREGEEKKEVKVALTSEDLEAIRHFQDIAQNL